MGYRFALFTFVFLIGGLCLADTTLPEFECTAVKIEDKKAAATIIGFGSFPSFSLRSERSGSWQFRINGTLAKLESGAVAKPQKITSAGAIYDIRFRNHKLRVDLTGTPPSRQGQLWLNDAAPEMPKLLAQVTRH